VIEEAQVRVARLAFVGVVVELELARLEKPVVLSRLAGGEARVEEAVVVWPEKLHALAAAARRPLALQQEPRLVERAGVLERVVLERRPEEAVDAALQAHAAGALELAELAVIAQVVAEHAHLAAPDLRRAARAHLEVAHALDLLRIDGG
jgi:hypothetical protein